MLDRRMFLTGAGSLAVIAGLYWTRRPTAAAEPSFEIQKTEAEWRRILTPAQFDVLRRHATELPGSSALDHEKREGTFACAGCDLPLFSSATKFDSGTGWPSFYRPLPGAVETDRGSHLIYDAHRSALPPLWRPSWTRLRRWPAAHRVALLHERCRLEVHAGCRTAGMTSCIRCICWLPAAR